MLYTLCIHRQAQIEFQIVWTTLIRRGAQIVWHIVHISWHDTPIFSNFISDLVADRPSTRHLDVVNLFATDQEADALLFYSQL